jgi:hypothetical protein
MNQDANNQSPDFLDDDALDALFAQARDDAPAPVPDALRARLMADAIAAQPRRVRQNGFGSRLGGWLAELGGVPGLAGVAAAGLAGVWIGFSGPGMTGDLVAEFWQGAATVSPTVSGWIEEGPLVVAGSDLLTLMNDEAE